MSEERVDPDESFFSILLRFFEALAALVALAVFGVAAWWGYTHWALVGLGFTILFRLDRIERKLRDE